MSQLSLRERFESQFIKDAETGCWNWVGSMKPHRGEVRGRAMINGRRDMAHRWAYTIYCGEIPHDRQVNHHCDNTLCVNPEHLYLGTQQDNVRDRVSRGRTGPRHGEYNGNSKLTTDDVRHIRVSACRNADLARQFGVSDVLIGLIRMRKAWGHVDG